MPGEPTTVVQSEAKTIAAGLPEPQGRSAEATLGSLPDLEIRGILGRGGMGIVYSAWQLSLNRPVAVKSMLHLDQARPEDLLRFRMEAEASARLQHPHIVQIYSVGQHQGSPYFLMEFVPGNSLAQQLATALPKPEEAAQLAEKLARAMHYAHEKGIIHRDLKPGNVLMTPEGTPKIADFGLAKFTAADAGFTTTGAVVGTVNYMAPEQAWGKSQVREVGPAADIYALGAILYEMLTGRPPFRGESAMETLAKLENEEPTPPRRLQHRVPRELETICLKCLEKSPWRRYASAAALAEDLRRFQANEPIVARPAGIVRRAQKWIRRHPARSVGIGTLLVLLVLLLLYAQSEWKRRDLADQQRAQHVQSASSSEGAGDVELAAARLPDTPGRFRRAAEAYGKSAAHLEQLDDPDVAGEAKRLRAKQVRTAALAEFDRQAQLAWLRAGEENDEQARAASLAALVGMGAAHADGSLADGPWWERLPVQDLLEVGKESGRLQATQVRVEVYRQLILLALLRTKQGLMKLNSVQVVVGLPNPEAARFLRSGLACLQAARTQERLGLVPPSKTCRIVIDFNMALLAKVGGRDKPPALDSDPAPQHGHAANATDDFFLGCLHFYLGRSGAEKVAEIMLNILGNKSPDLDLNRPLDRASQLFRGSVRTDPNQYWPHFMLGWTLYQVEDFSGAELAFNACVWLQPDNPRGYEQRALALMREAVRPLRGYEQRPLRRLAQQPRDSADRAELRRRADEDSARSLALAPDDPSTYWPRADLLLLLSRPGEALRAYERALELDVHVASKMSRSQGLVEADRCAQELLKQTNGMAEMADARADAHAVRGLIFYRRGNAASARAAIEKALQERPDHPRALALRKEIDGK
jgi:tetratricopeptide (TPR) repeat protein